MTYGNKRKTAGFIWRSRARLFGGGVPTCSHEHKKPRAAKYRVFFKNGNYRDVCGWCVKQYKTGREKALVDHILKLKDNGRKMV